MSANFGVLLLFVLSITAGLGKLYQRCELARELRDKHNISVDQVGEWVCYAQYTSKLNTSARTDEHVGIFLIHKGWCLDSVQQCSIVCEQRLDGDIADDVTCMRKVEWILQRLAKI